MTLDQALQRAAESAASIERSVADAKGGYHDVLRQVMVHQTALFELRAEVRGNEEAALKRHDELLELLRGRRG
jgi:hypothetical protein